MGIIAIFALATLAMVLLSLKRPSARVVALLLATSWAVSIAAYFTGMDREPRLTLGVTLDTIGAVAAIIAWRIIWPPKNWLLLLAVELFAQVAAHRALDTAPRGTLGATLNILYALQLLTVVIGPRVGEIVGHARDLFGSLFAAPHTRDRRRGVVATADAIVQRIGSAALREKSR